MRRGTGTEFLLWPLKAATRLWIPTFAQASVPCLSGVLATPAQAGLALCPDRAGDAEFPVLKKRRTNSLSSRCQKAGNEPGQLRHFHASSCPSKGCK